ncbi:MAG: C25 family cysteine peptidase, partial [Planctomycetota bacterium]
MNDTLLCKVCSIIFIAALTLAYPCSIALANHDEKVEMRVRCDSLDRTVIDYTIEGFDRKSVTIDGEDCLFVYLGHAAPPIMDEAGNPQLPALRRSIMIPDAARMEVRILNREYYDIEDVRIAPWKGPILRSVDPSSVPYTFSAVYEKDAWYPGEAASLQDPYILHDVRGLVVEVFPFRYNPVKKVLRVYTRIEVEVKTAGPGQVNTIDRSTFGHKPDRSFATLYERHFVNHAGSRTEPPPEDGDMLVICHGPFMAAMEPFVDWKNFIGIPTTMVDVATIGNNEKDIKAYIESVYNGSNLSYVLLVGDYDEIVCPYFWGGVSGLSDPSYSLMTHDVYPDLFIGRFSAETVAHVETQVRRTIEYEQEGHDISMGEWNTWGTGLADDDGPFGEHYHETDNDHMHLIRDELLDYGFTQVDPFHPTAKKHYVSKSLNEGRRILNYCGHGGNHGWGTSGFSVVEVDELTNVGRLPFINAVACEGGIFKDDTCFGEVWLRATHNGQPTGAIACYMCSTGMYGPQPMFAQGNHAYYNKYGGADRFWMEMNWSLAGCWFGGSCLMLDLCGDAGVDMFMTWHIFG